MLAEDPAPSLSPSPSLVGGDREPAHTLKLTEDLAPPLLPFLLLSFYPSLPLRPSPSLPSYRVGGDKEPAHKLLLYLNPSPSLPPAIPPSLLPSLLCRSRQGTSIHTKVDRRSRAQEAPWNGNEAVVLPKALCLWHKMSLAQTVSGTNCLWHKRSLAQTVSGTNCLWRKLTSNTKISRQPRSSLNALSLSRIKVCKYIPGNQFI